MVLQGWDAVRDARRMEEVMNRLWHGFVGSPSLREGVESWNILIDVLQKKDDIIVRASMPGVKPEGIDVAVEDDILTLRAERKQDIEDADTTYLKQECPTGSFYRALRLPDTVDSNKIRSHYENGVLTITMPKAEEKKKRQIQVKVDSGPKAIEDKK